MRNKISFIINILPEKIILCLEAAELTAEEAHFLLQPFHAFQHMMNGVDAFDIDRDRNTGGYIFPVPGAGRREDTVRRRRCVFRSTLFFERNNKSRVGMALLAIFVENN